MHSRERLDQEKQLVQQDSFAYYAKMNAINYASHLDVFLDVARLGSFSAVARKRRVAVSSIVRRIDTLEQQLETQLLIRSTRSIQLTASGQLLADRSPDMVNQLIDLRSELSGIDDPSGGRLRVSCLPSLGRHHILPIIAKLLGDYPKLNIELELTEHPFNPVYDRLDAAVRIGEQPDSRLYATFVGHQQWRVCAQADYIVKMGKPSQLRELRSFRKIAKVRELPEWGWRRLEHLIRFDDDELCLRCDDFEGQRIAVQSGLGVGMLPNWLVDEDIRSGELIHLLADLDLQTEPIYVLRSLPRASVKLQRFTQALKVRLKECTLG
ncbi:MAG: HTH-type transcriptional regulator DmlR [Candidatus Celerinatantimonas neptuna]|nr:MAG: HTH-type transcriptional regulator DmlR [Candidatus Celerinatantimonas neptuna]